MKFCQVCGAQIDLGAKFCDKCGVSIDGAAPNRQNPYQPFPHQQPYQYYQQYPLLPKFYKAGFVLGILSMCIPVYGIIIGIVGLPLACISKRQSSIAMNIIGIILWVFIIVMIVVLDNM
jgi:predicted nucleic acid-binding Zn ribbon protein